MRAFGYVRLSKEDQDSTSPQRQRERIERLCRERGWELVETFEDIDVSAFNGKRRPAFTRMMARLGDVQAIVFWRLDRLSRSVLEFSKLLEQTQAAKVQLVSTDQPIDTSSAMGKAFVQVASVFAELEAGTISERSRQMMAFKRDRGEPVGKVPFGWRRVGKHYEPDPEQQAILREAARRYVAGETLEGIAQGLAFSAPAVIRRILHSQQVQDSLPEPLAGELVEALRRRRFKRVPESRQSLLGGIATCAECSGTLARHSTKAGRRNGRWFSYGCRIAGHVHISGTWLDAFVADQVIGALDSKRLVAAVRRRQESATAPGVAVLEARLAALEEAHFVEATIPADRYRRLRGELVDKLKAARAADRSAPSDLPLEIARDPAGRWDSLTIADRRRVIGAVLERIVVTRASGPGPIDPVRVTLVWRR